MSWVVFAVATMIFFGLWGFFGKVGLREAHWSQINFIYGVSILVLFIAVLAAQSRKPIQSAGLWPVLGSAVFGACGLVTFYLALDRQRASLVVPTIAVYPVVTALLAVLFLDERLTALQAGGIACALTGVVLIGIGR